MIFLCFQYIHYSNFQNAMTWNNSYNIKDIISNIFKKRTVHWYFTFILSYTFYLGLGATPKKSWISPKSLEQFLNPWEQLHPSLFQELGVNVSYFVGVLDPSLNFTDWQFVVGLYILPNGLNYDNKFKK